VTYLGSWESVRSHLLPQWYDDAKLGIFLHWGLYSVPAWAPRGPDITTLLREHRPSWMLRNIPYAEWYANTLRLAGSPTARRHKETYGTDFPYDGFRSEFEDASTKADLDSLAAFCLGAGARYVVLTTKHADGYCLWPTTEPHPVKGRYHSPRDLVGDMSNAVTDHGMRMGLYYCGGYDWPYNDAVLSNLGDLLLGGPRGTGYARYVDSHVRELIERYRPSILWNDIGWPFESDLRSLLAAYYNCVEDGAVNDRWFQGRRSRPIDVAVRAASAVVEGLWPVLPRSAKRVAMLPGRHADFSTREYAIPDKALAGKWEATRGMGSSFGANRSETADDVLSADDLVRLLMDVVSKNGNLLIGVGPGPDGRVSEVQSEPLLGLGRWLEVNGEAVYGTRPWTVASGSTSQGSAVRYTAGDDAIYATVLGTPKASEFSLERLSVDVAGDRARRDRLSSAVDIGVLGAPHARFHVSAEGRLTIDFGTRPPEGPAHVVRLRPRSLCRAEVSGWTPTA
jgi:alpha-L-fucosidase